MWGRFEPSRLERLSRGDPAHSWTPPLAVPPNFLLWLGLWGVGVQQEGCFLPCPLRTFIWWVITESHVKSANLCGLKLLLIYIFVFFFRFDTLLLLGKARPYIEKGNRLKLAYILKLCWRLGFKWTITRNSIITSYIRLTNLRRKVGIWFPRCWEVEQLWWTELPFKQWFSIDWTSGSESVRRMCSVRIMRHQSFCFNHNTCSAVTHTAPPRASRHQLPKHRQLFPPSPTSQPVHNKQDIH